MPPRAAEKLHAGARRWRPEDYASRLDQEIRDFIFVLGDLDSHDICAELCAGTGFDVMSPDCRPAPEHSHPAAFEDCCAAFD